MDSFATSPIFPDLVAAAGNREVLTVSELNEALALMLDKEFPLLWVAGEVSGFTRAASGHWYFTLKDDDSQIRVVMFRGRARLASFTPKHGDHIEVRGTLGMYQPRGELQLNVDTIRHAGAGNRYEAFLRLKAKLESEGLFRADRKRAIPVFVETVGIVTSPQAAALRDVLTTLARRAPHVRIILYPTLVQGADAHEKIAEAIALASGRAECDALLVCRGGGSIEDLWSFNEETVARAIAACSLPVISGIGHETDFTIADFVADVRAPTPTAAAELVSRSRNDWLEGLSILAMRMARTMERRINQSTQHTDMLLRRLVSPKAYIHQERQRLNTFEARMRAKLPDSSILNYQLSGLREQLRMVASASLGSKRQHIRVLSTQLELLNPQRILDRGYAIMQNERGQIVRSPADIPVKRPMMVRLAKGSAEVVVDSVQQVLP